MNIADFYDEIAHCNRCGFCQTACPIFRSTGHEAGVARGRLALLRAIIEKRLEWQAGLEAPLYDCLLCGACTANCFPAIRTSDLIVKARCEYLERVGRGPLHRILFDYLLPYPRRLHFAARAAALGKNSGLSRMAAAVGLLRPLGRDFVRAEEIVTKMPARALRDTLRPGEYHGTGSDICIGWFVGCGMDMLQQTAAHSTLALLRRIGRSVRILNNCCCGLPAWSYGDLEASRRLVEKNLDLIKLEGMDVLVTDCSSCAGYLKSFPQRLPDSHPMRFKAEQLADKVRDMVEVIGGITPEQETLSRSAVVTYHDPCHAARGQDLRQAPRELLEALPGITYKELPEADWCCGGAGSYAYSHYTLSRRVLDRKIENLKHTGADIIATSCPACMIHLSYGIRNHGLKTRVCHISELVYDSSLQASSPAACS